jgi:hypothetical protein
MFYDPEGAALH